MWNTKRVFVHVAKASCIQNNIGTLWLSLYGEMYLCTIEHTLLKIKIPNEGFHSNGVEE